MGFTIDMNCNKCTEAPLRSGVACRRQSVDHHQLRKSCALLLGMDTSSGLLSLLQRLFLLLACSPLRGS